MGNEKLFLKRKLTPVNPMPLWINEWCNNTMGTVFICIIEKTYISQNAKEGYEKNIGDQLREDPTLWSKDPLESLEQVLNRKCAYAAVIE